MTGDGRAAEKKREKRTITEIHESEKTGEKMVYQSYNTVDRALANFEEAYHPDHRHWRPRQHGWANPALPRPARRGHRLQAEIHQALCQADRGCGSRHQAICERGQRGLLPDDDHSYTVNEAEYEKFARMVAKRRQI